MIRFWADPADAWQDGYADGMEGEEAASLDPNYRAGWEEAQQDRQTGFGELGPSFLLGPGG